jgi:predicted cation transporter
MDFGGFQREVDSMVIGLGIILLAVLALPFVSKKVEHNLELFLFIMGLLATLVSGAWIVHSGPDAGGFNIELLIKALHSPLLITAAVFVAGMLFKLLFNQLQNGIAAVLKVVPVKVFLFGVVLVLGLASSVITAIIAALVLVEIINVLKLEREQEVALTIIACFSIGLGAALTPMGEPLATIAVSKLGQDFWYLTRLLGIYILPGVVALAGFTAFYIKPGSGDTTLTGSKKPDTYQEVIVRALKVYLFVMALELLGEGFRPVIDMYVLGLHHNLLYWLNMISAVLDNATLTAAEISVKMTSAQIKSILLGLLISGGMLIPGNIPNIISAGKLKIKSSEWARLGVPMGLVIMAVYFIILNI